ncbi:MAG TPA: DUF2079 domain-containing protein [Acidimicrobiales bacterium]|jgi:hypothetical protein
MTSAHAAGRHQDEKGSPVYKRGPRFGPPVASFVFGGQFIALTVYSWFQYHRFDLGIDFATINQAATEISRGNLDPYSTIVSSSYLDNHFGLILWPIAILLLVFRSPFVLLVVQNLSLVGTGIVVFAWTSALLVSRAVAKRFAYGVLVVVVLLLLVNPLVYYSAALDFHLEATATFFAVFAAYDVWSGRHRRAWLWVGLCLLCGDLGGLCVVGVGISALLAGRATRRPGLLLVGAGVVWVGLITVLHANQGSLLDQYAYLAGRSTLPAGFRGAVVVLGGMIAHPGRPLHVLGNKARMIWRYLPPGGVIGIITPWGIGVPAIVLLSSALQGNTLFIGEPFQQFAVVPFVLIGSVALVTSLATAAAPLHLPSQLWNSHRTTRWLAAGILLVAILLGGVRYAHEYLRGSFTDNATMSLLPASEADALGIVLAHTPADAEVIASGDISGRFSARRHVYIYQTVKGSIPLRAMAVELVMDTAHYPYISGAQQVAAADLLEARFGARTVLHRDGVWELAWTESSQSSSIVLP